VRQWRKPATPEGNGPGQIRKKVPPTGAEKGGASVITKTRPRYRAPGNAGAWGLGVRLMLEHL
jgi:hypothetical protein